MFTIALKGFGSCTRDKILWQIAWYGLFDKREIQGFLRIKRERKGKCETYFTYFPFCGLHVPLYL